MSWLISRALMEAYANSLSSPGLVEEYLGESSLGGAPSALLSGSHTPRAFLPPDRMTAFSRPARFGMTFGPLTDTLGAELLTWFLVASRARISALPARAPALTASAAGCGDTWRGSWAKFDPASSSWKTAQPSLLGGSDEFSVTWPRSGMTAGGLCWELPMSVPRISVTGFGSLLPTPTSAGFECQDVPKLLARREKYAEKYGNNGFGLTLNQYVKVQAWPTPTSSLGTKGGRVTPRKSREGGTLIEAVHARAMWPTPTTMRGITAAAAEKEWGRKGSADLRTAVHIYATHDKTSRPLSDQIGGSLNPTWVEGLMGWPRNWTQLKDKDESKKGTGAETLPTMFSADDPAALGQWQVGQPLCEPFVLQHHLRRVSGDKQAAGWAEACAEGNTNAQVQSVPADQQVAATSQGPQPDEQQSFEHRSSVPEVPHRGSQDGQDLGPWGPGWEDGIPRVAVGVIARVDRLKAIGNGQVPLCAATAWRMLTGGEQQHA